MNTCAQIISVSSFVPPKIVTNHDLSKIMDTTDEWIKDRSGISQRHIVEESVSTSDLAAQALKQALEKASLKGEDLDLIIAATLTPDYYFPGIGVLIQRKVHSKAAAIDIRGQCSGFNWGISTANAYIKSGLAKTVAVVGADIHSRVIEFSSRGRNVSVLFGDGAGAMILSATNEKEAPSAHNKIRGVIDSLLGSDGEGAELLAITRPGHSGPQSFITAQEAEEKAYLPVMDGKQVFKNAVIRMSEAAETILKRNNIQGTDLDFVLCHQANIRINQMVADKLGIPPEKTHNNIHKYGNTTSASLPLVMEEAENLKKLKKGDLVLTLSFGSGFTWGANLIRW